MLFLNRKNSKALVAGYKWLVDNYGIDADSYKYDYATQKRVSEHLLDEMKNENSLASKLGYHWAEYSMALEYHPAEMGRGDKVIFYSINILKTNGVIEYRNDCWDIFIELAPIDKWREQILIFLEKYGRQLRKEMDPGIITEDIHKIEQLLGNR